MYQLYSAQAVQFNPGLGTSVRAPWKWPTRSSFQFFESEPSAETLEQHLPMSFQKVTLSPCSFLLLVYGVRDLISGRSCERPLQVHARRDRPEGRMACALSMSQCGVL